MSTLASVGADIRAARRAAGITASELSERAGISRVTLRELENGLGNSRLATVLAVCEVLGLDLLFASRKVSALIAGDEEPARPTQLSELVQQTRLAGLNYARRSRKEGK